MQQDDRDICVERIAGVMWIRLSRPQAMNALSPAMLDVIGDAIDAAAIDDGVRCVVFVGEGKAFCTGADLSTVPGGGAGLEAFVAKASLTMSRIEALEKPVIACLNGATLAGGLELALCADIVVASASAQIGDGHVNFGLLPGAGGSVRLARAYRGWTIATGEEGSARAMSCAAEALVQILGLGDQTWGVEG